MLWILNKTISCINQKFTKHKHDTNYKNSQRKRKNTCQKNQRGVQAPEH